MLKINVSIGLPSTSTPSPSLKRPGPIVIVDAFPKSGVSKLSSAVDIPVDAAVNVSVVLGINLLSLLIFLDWDIESVIAVWSTTLSVISLVVTVSLEPDFLILTKLQIWLWAFVDHLI